MILAGEPSGDRLGAALITALRTETDGKVNVSGVGGAAMAAVGISSLFPIADIAVMGLVEVLPRLPRIHRRIRQVVHQLIDRQPQVVVTIDSPDFMHRVVRRARRHCPNTKFANYVAPTVWAWRPNRAKKIAELYDLQLALLPFEPKYFKSAGLDCEFVGHPVVEYWGRGLPERSAARRELGIGEDAVVLVVLPGSRRGEIQRIGPTFGSTLADFAREQANLVVLVPVAHGVEDPCRRVMAEWSVSATALDTSGDGEREQQKWNAFAAADIALATSGTTVLELAAAGVPTVVAYRASPITWWVASRLTQHRTASLINILLDEPVVPEFLQGQCRPELLAPALTTLLNDPQQRERQLAGGERALSMLKVNGVSPSRRAAQAVLGLVDALPSNF